MQFTYEAKTATGQTISGSLEADDERTAASQIRAQGHFVMRLRPIKGAQPGGRASRVAPAPAHNTYQRASAQTPGVLMTPPAGAQAIPGQSEVTAYPGSYQGGYETGGPSGLTSTPQTQAWYEPPATATSGEPPLTWLWNRLFRPLFPGVTPFQLAATYRQFGALLGAGVPLHVTLDTVAAEAATPEMRKAIDRMRPTIAAGGKLSDGMRFTPWIFQPSHCAMVIPGEVVGGIDIVFNRLADMVESEHRLRLRLQQEMVRPFITLGSMFLLPPLFYLVLGLWKLYLYEAVFPFLAMILAIFGVFVATRLLSQARVFWDTFVAGLPSIGKIIRMLTIARFCRMLGMLYSGGVAVPVAVNYAADACGNVYLSFIMRKVAGYVEAGYQLVDGFAAVHIFPPLVISMMGTGEMTGKVDTMMTKVAEYYEAEADLSIHKSVNGFSLLILILVAIRVLVILVRFYTGYFQHLLDVTDTGLLI